MGASELIGNEGQKPIDISGLVSIVNEVEILGDHNFLERKIEGSLNF